MAGYEDTGMGLPDVQPLSAESSSRKNPLATRSALPDLLPVAQPVSLPTAVSSPSARSTEAAAVHDIAENTGLSPLAVSKDTAGARNALRQKQAREVEQSAPDVARFLVDNPRARDAAGDDFGQLGTVAEALKFGVKKVGNFIAATPEAFAAMGHRIGVTAATTVPELLSDALGSAVDDASHDDDLREALGLPRRSALSQAVIDATREFSRNRAEASAEDMASIDARLAQRYSELGLSRGEVAALQGAESVALTVGAMGAGLLTAVSTRNHAPLEAAFKTALPTMAAYTGLDSYARGEGMPFAERLRYAATDAAIEYGTEKIPMGKLLGSLKAGDPFFKTLLTQMAIEVPTELAATTLQDLNAWASLPENADKPFSEYVDALPQALMDTVYATMYGTLLQTGGVHTVNRVVEHFDKTAQQREALAFEERVKAFNKANEAITLRVNDPKSFSQFASTFLQQGDDTVYIDRSKLQEIIAADPKGAEEVLKHMPKSQESALLSGNGGMVELDVGELLAALPGSSVEQAMVQNLRRTAVSPSAAEVREMPEEVLRQETVDKLKAANEKLQTTKKFRDSAARVRERLVEDLIGTRLVDPGHARLQADLYAAFATTLAARLGVLPEEALARWRDLRVMNKEQTQEARAAARTPAGEALRQSPLHLDLSETGKKARMVRDTEAGTSLIYRVDGGELIVESLSTYDRKKRGKGAARRLLEQVTAQADIAGLPVRAELVAEQRGVDMGRLRALYEAAGFAVQPTVPETPGGVPVRRAARPALAQRDQPGFSTMSAFEVAPNPADAALAGAWNTIPFDDRARFTNDLAAELVPQVLDAIGVQARLAPTIGAFRDDVNPAMAAILAPEDAARAGVALATVLRQESVLAVSTTPAEGLQPGQAVHLQLPETAGLEDVQALYATLRQKAPGAVEGATFDPLSKTMLVLDFSGRPFGELAAEIADATPGEVLVSPVRVFYKFAEPEAENGQVADGAGRAGAPVEDVRGRGLRDLAAQAEQRVREFVAARAPRDGSGRDQGGSLAPLAGAPVVEGATGPDPRLVAVAEQYARENGIPYSRQPAYAEIDPEFSKRVADAFEAMQHAPNDPAVREAYADLIRQTLAQYRALEAAGYRFWFYDESNDPYNGNPWNAMRDLRATQSMGVFATEAGYGSEASDVGLQYTVDEMPLLTDTGITWPYGSLDGPQKKVTANDLFRAVHDAFGHGLEGAGFRAQGEENAWQAHQQLFTGPALAALTTETRGQNSWLNYGLFGEKNRTAAVGDTVFAPQKTGLMPSWTWTERVLGDDTLRQEPRQVDEELIARAKKLFGLTNDPREAGYVLPDGTMLDFSERRNTDRQHWRDLAGQRNEDHRAVQELVDSSGSEAMVEFLQRTGAVRVDFNSDVVSLWSPPSLEQIRVIGNAMRGKNGYLSYHDHNGDTVHEAEIASMSPQRLARFVQEATSDTFKQYGQFHVPTFYSPAVAAISNAKQAKMTVAQWRAVISKTPGVKKEELDWMQFEEMILVEGLRKVFAKVLPEEWSDGKRQRYLMAFIDNTKAAEGGDQWPAAAIITEADSMLLSKFKEVYPNTPATINVVSDMIEKQSIDKATMLAAAEQWSGHGEIVLNYQLRTTNVTKDTKDLITRQDQEFLDRVEYYAERVTAEYQENEATLSAENFVGELLSKLRRGWFRDTISENSREVFLNPEDQDDLDQIAKLRSEGVELKEKVIPAAEGNDTVTVMVAWEVGEPSWDYDYYTPEDSTINFDEDEINVFGSEEECIWYAEKTLRESAERYAITMAYNYFSDDNIDLYHVKDEIQEEAERRAVEYFGDRLVDELPDEPSGLADSVVLAHDLPRWTGTKRNNPSYNIDATIKGGKTEPFELVVQWEAGDELFSENTHFPNAKNAIGFIRGYFVADTEGKRVCVLDELQSDWAQEGRKGGFGDMITGPRWVVERKAGAQAAEDKRALVVNMDNGERITLPVDKLTGPFEARGHDSTGNSVLALLAVNSEQAFSPQNITSVYWIDAAGAARKGFVPNASFSGADYRLNLSLVISDVYANGREIERGQDVPTALKGMNFASEEELRAKLATNSSATTKAEQDARYVIRLEPEAQYRAAVEDMPFKETKTWAKLLLKHGFAYGVEHGAEKIAILPGYAHHNRWNLSQFMGKLVLERQWEDGQVPTKVGMKAYDNSGRPMPLNVDEVWAHDLAKYTSKEMAKSAMAAFEDGQTGVTFSDNPNETDDTKKLQIKWKGEDLRPFYDQALASEFRSLAKNMGAELTTAPIMSESGKVRPQTENVVVGLQLVYTDPATGKDISGDAYPASEFGASIRDVVEGIEGSALEWLLPNGGLVSVVRIDDNQNGTVKKTPIASMVVAKEEYGDSEAIRSRFEKEIVQPVTEAASKMVDADTRKFIDAPALVVTDKFREATKAPMPLYQNGDEAFGEYDPLLNIITMLEPSSKNLSTFLHEAGHAFLEISMRAALEQDAPQDLIDDMQETLRWFGFKGTIAEWLALPVSQRRGNHEQWARSFERYLFEGNAPSEKLRTPFESFKRWLGGVYTSLVEFLRRNPNAGRLNDSIRGVMDRMLATPEEIARARDTRELEPLFNENDANATPEYKAAVKQAQQDAEGDILARQLRDMQWFRNAHSRVLNRLRKANAAKRNAVRDDVKQQLSATGVYAALLFLRKGVNPPGAFAYDGPPMKLSTADVDSLFPADHPQRSAVDKLKKGGRYAVVSPDGVHPDVLAGMFGFGSGEALVEALATAQPFNEAVDDATDAEMLARYGDITSDAALAKAADKALHGDMTARVLETEAAALDKLARVGGTLPDAARAARATARALVSRAKVGALRPLRYIAAEAAAGRESRAAYKRGEFDKAAKAKRDQLLQNQLAREAYAAEDEIAQTLKYFRKFRKASIRKAMGGPDLLQIDALLSRFDFATGITQKELAKREGLKSYLLARSEQLDAATPDVAEWLFNEGLRQSYKQLTVEELRNLRDAVKQLERMARREREMYKANKNMTFAQERDAILARMLESHPSAFDPDTKAPKPVLDSLVRSLSEKAKTDKSDFLGNVIGLETFAALLEGGRVGAIHDALFRRLSDAQSYKARRLEQLYEMLKPAMDAYTLAERAAFSTRPILHLYGEPVSRESAVVAALLNGSATGQQRLENFGWTGADKTKLFDLLTDKDHALIEAIWKMFDHALWPEVKALNERTRGIAPPKTEPLGFIDSKGRKFTGGYFPLSYSARENKIGEKIDETRALGELRGGLGMSAKTADTASHERVAQVSARPKLTLEVMSQSLNETVHDVAFREAVADTMRLLNDPVVKAAIINVVEYPFYRAMRQRVGEIAAKPQIPNSIYDKVFRMVKRNVIVTLLSGFKTALFNFTGVFPALSRLPPHAAAIYMKHFARAMADGAFVREYRAVTRESEYMRTRFGTRERDLKNQLDKFSMRGQFLPDTGSLLFLMGFTDIAVTTPLWRTAYELRMNEELKNGTERDAAHTDAVAYADHIVRQTQGSGRDVDVPNLLSQTNKLMVSYTLFHSYFNSQFQQLVLAGAISREEAQKNRALALAKFTGRFMCLWVLPAVVGTAMFSLAAGVQNGDAGGDDEDWYRKYLRGFALYGMAYLPFTRILAPFAYGQVDPDPAKPKTYRVDVTPLAAYPEGVVKGGVSLADMLGEEGVNPRDEKQVIMALGFAVGLPGKLVADTVVGTEAWLADEAPPTAILLGPPKGYK